MIMIKTSQFSQKDTKCPHSELDHHIPAHKTTNTGSKGKKCFDVVSNKSMMVLLFSLRNEHSFSPCQASVSQFYNSQLCEGGILIK